MKKLIYFASMLLTVGIMGACSKDDIENTATVDLSGDWYVTVDVADANGNVIEGGEDFNGGRCHMLTYNTTNNVPTELYVDDQYNLVGFKAVTTCDVTNLTFSATGAENEGGSRYVGDQVTVTNGKVVKGGGRQKNGSVTDSIYFEVKISDDQYAATYGYDHYIIHGVRYSGLAEND